MSAPIVHIYLAEKLFRKIPRCNMSNRQRYFTGTLFPDIRYLGSLKRSTTHIINPKIEKLKNIKDDFTLGQYIHNLVDITLSPKRRTILSEEFSNTNHFIVSASKLFEDSLCPTDTVLEVINHLREPDVEELKLTTQEEVGEWHKILTNYLGAQPSEKTIKRFISELNINPEAQNYILEAYNLIANRPHLIKKLKTMILNTFKQRS